MDIVTISIVLGFTAGAIQLVGYIVYNKVAGDKINTGSWSMWAIAGIVDLASYIAVTGDWVKNILPAVCAFAAISTFVYAYVRKRLSWPDKLDWVFVGADGAITVVWVMTNAVLANILYQATAVLSFVPIYRGIISGREREHLWPWVIWTLAYSFLTASVYLRLARWEELVYPVTHIVIHAIVVVLVLIKPAR